MRLARFTLEDHAYSASRLPKTTVLQATGVYFNDAMLRQISEGIKINNVDEDSLINSKNEWNYFQISRAVVTHGRVIHRDEISRGDI